MIAEPDFVGPDTTPFLPQAMVSKNQSPQSSPSPDFTRARRILNAFKKWREPNISTSKLLSTQNVVLWLLAQSIDRHDLHLQQKSTLWWKPNTSKPNSRYGALLTWDASESTYGTIRLQKLANFFKIVYFFWTRNSNSFFDELKTRRLSNRT